jgi:hypothetical protein
MYSGSQFLSRRIPDLQVFSDVNLPLRETGFRKRTAQWVLQQVYEEASHI